MPKVSKRTHDLMLSPIRKFEPLVLAAEKKGIKVLKLNSGNPDLSPPAQFLQTIKKYQQKNIGYSPSSGIVSHVEAWVKYYSKFGVKLKSENIIPTVGAAEAMLLALITVANPGDEILVFEPLYASYKGFALMAGIKLVPITLNIENNFALPKESEIVKKITSKTKAIIIINPNNPTGTCLSDKEIKLIIKIVNKYDLFLLSDEVYREIVFTGKPTSFLKFDQIKERLIILDSASKRFSLPGIRIGCLVSLNQDVAWSILKLAMVRLSVPTLEQYGLVPLLNNSNPYIKKIVIEYKKRCDLVFDSLNKIPGVVCQKPQGAFYIMAKLPVKNAEDFIKFLLTKFSYQGKTILLTPAAEFYITPNIAKDEVRIAYVLSIKELKEVIIILEKALKEYLKKVN